jgi:hypothetical protein
MRHIRSAVISFSVIAIGTIGTASSSFAQSLSSPSSSYARSTSPVYMRPKPPVFVRPTPLVNTPTVSNKTSSGGTTFTSVVRGNNTNTTQSGAVTVVNGVATFR